jgi:hypothetical protein
MENTREVEDNTNEHYAAIEGHNTLRVAVEKTNGSLSKTGLDKYMSPKYISGQSSMLKFNQVSLNRNTNYQTNTTSFKTTNLGVSIQDDTRVSPSTTFHKQKFMINNRNDSMSFHI